MGLSKNTYGRVRLGQGGGEVSSSVKLMLKFSGVHSIHPGSSFAPPINGGALTLISKDSI